MLRYNNKIFMCHVIRYKCNFEITFIYPIINTA